MLGVTSLLASHGFFRGGSIGNILAQWEAIGVFSFVLPFLLMFAIVFMILNSVPLFRGNKGVNAIIALSVALMALQFGFVSVFFSELFPRVGIALSIIMVVIILLGLFIDPDKKGFKWIYVIIGLVLTSVVIFKSLTAFGWYGGYFGGIYWSDLIWVALVIAALVIIIVGTKPTKKFGIPDINPVLFRGYPEKE